MYSHHKPLSLNDGVINILNKVIFLMQTEEKKLRIYYPTKQYILKLIHSFYGRTYFLNYMNVYTILYINHKLIIYGLASSFHRERYLLIAIF